MNHLLIFGVGYTGKRLATALAAEGWRVTGTTRSAESRDKLIAHGFDAVRFDDAAEALTNASHILSSIPPDDAGDPALQVYGDRIVAAPRQWLGYLSTTGVYGDLQGGEATEATPPNPSNARSARRVVAEDQWRALDPAGHVFRLPGIYGPGRSALDRVVAQARYTVKPGHRFSRVHVDDIVGAVMASIAAPDPGTIYNVSDDLPAETGDTLEFAANLLGVPMPKAVPFEEADLSPMARSFYADNRTVSNARLKSRLGYSLRYPTYREGLRAIYSAG